MIRELSATPRLLRTIRPLRARQVLHQLHLRLRGPARVPARTHAAGVTGLLDHARGWPGPAPDGLWREQGAALVGQAPHDPLRDGWSAPARDPLWRYTLHYHGWLRELGPRDPWRVVQHWIDHHPRGVGWEPYPTAMRVLQWIGLLARAPGPVAGARVLTSLAAQLEHLERNLEHHLDGNHLWTDLAALSCAGLALAGPTPARLRARWLPAFADVVAAQLTDDGVHRERAPSYHCLLAWQLAGVVWLADSARDARARPLARALARMVAALPAFTHPDGDVALWGDSQRGADARPETLLGTWRPLLSTLDLGAGDTDAAHDRAGFARRAWGPWTVLWNRGDIALPHQVGHVHGDALALELSLGDERVLVDAGVGTYTRGPARAYVRGTAAHNTVTVGPGRGDQHELWASHRVGGRARITAVAGDEHALRGRVLGFGAPAEHERELAWDGARLRCRDRVHPRALATARYHVPSSCLLTPAPSGWRVQTPGGRVLELTSDPPLRRERELVAGWLGFHRPARRHCLLAPVGPHGLEVTLSTPG